MPSANNGTANSANFTFDDGPSTHTITARILDKDGGLTDYDAVIKVDNVDPTATIVAPSEVNEGSQFVVSLTAPHDPSTADTTAGFTYAFSVDGGAFVASANGGTSTSANFTFDDGPSTHTITGRILDKDGGSTDYDAVIQVNNVDPTATIVAPTEVNEGEPIRRQPHRSARSEHWPTSRPASRTPFRSIMRASSRAPTTARRRRRTSPSTTASSTCTITARILDKDGGLTDYDAVIQVDNVDPTATLVAPTRRVDEASTFSVGLVDPTAPSMAATNAVVHYAFAGDGVWQAGNTYAASSSTPSSKNFSFDDGPSTHTVTERILDKDGGFTDYNAVITVANVAPTADIMIIAPQRTAAP